MNKKMFFVLCFGLAMAFVASSCDKNIKNYKKGVNIIKLKKNEVFINAGFRTFSSESQNRFWYITRDTITNYTYLRDFDGEEHKDMYIFK